MFGRLSALVGGQQPTATPSTDMLPPELATIIAAARIIERTGSDEDSPRVLVQVPGGAFWYDAEQPSKWLTANWPELTAAQQSRALGLLGARVAQAQREATEAAVAAMRGRSGWRDWKPLERPWPGA
ncbi:hypothetical protein HF909_10705 [Ralstonia pseudosolanacearum]|uniref:Uncharacterized protein n=1 Tax=Ralstonia solanacearum TaxID=305 RepID=A0AA92QBE6_RALSL|nr:hypothetical protein [Ralstonia pseudosolanacearum]QOK96854.1 hypothetical protein HF909_10705 [Ralstonia pseudosolanacearum]